MSGSYGGGQVDLSASLEELGGLYLDEAEARHKRFELQIERLEPDRSAAGNGLSLVKAVADLHRAELRLEDNQPGLHITLLFTI